VQAHAFALWWSTATNTATWPSRVQAVVMSVPHMASIVSGMIVPSWLRPPGRAGARGRQQSVLAHQTQHTVTRRAKPGEAQARPHLAVAFAMEGTGVEQALSRELKV